MRPRWNALLPYACGAMLFLLSGCALPQLLAPQKDLRSSETIGPKDGRVVLVASRSSEFKRTLVDKLAEALLSAGMAQKTVGVGDLKEIDTSDYDMIVVISTCLGWELDRDVESFLSGKERQANIILVTTSASGAWVPDRGGRDFDAVSSASKMTTLDGVVRDVIARIQSRLHHAEPKIRD
ncbi:MAG: hypothetical protein AB1512_28465 [Thermodesulfobacteriota bacterium]